MRILTAVSIAVVLSLGSPLSADLLVVGGNTDHSIVPGMSLDDVRMEVELLASGGIATMTFSNVSVGGETGAVFKEIVLDTYDDDTSTAFLWNPVILTDTADVGYTVGTSNGLPGYHAQTTDPFPLFEFQAKPSPVKKGIGVGEQLQVQFNTNLADGSNIDDFLAAFGGGSDTAAFVAGFHAISADVVNGESLTGSTDIPEPGTLALLAVGGSLSLVRRRRRAAIA
jgi:hypothetical protein